MRKLLHPDFWVEVQAGEFEVGLDARRRQMLQDRFQSHLQGLPVASQTVLVSALRKQFQFASVPEPERSKLMAVQAKADALPATSAERASLTEERSRLWRSVQGRLLSSVYNDQENRARAIYLRVIAPIPTASLDGLRLEDLHLQLGYLPQARRVFVDRFYLSRFPVTSGQYQLFQRGTAASDLIGALEESEVLTVTTASGSKQVLGRQAAEVRTEHALRLCQSLGGRFPTVEEWEKGARGEDGRLYPWGDEWNPDAGFFFYGQAVPSEVQGGQYAVTAFPQGQSPWGAWAMAGGLPELVTQRDMQGGPSASLPGAATTTPVALKGVHPREVSAELAWLDHVVSMPGRGDWVSVRPALDKWPQTVWPAAQVAEEARGAAPAAG